MSQEESNVNDSIMNKDLSIKPLQQINDQEIMELGLAMENQKENAASQVAQLNLKSKSELIPEGKNSQKKVSKQFSENQKAKSKLDIIEPKTLQLASLAFDDVMFEKHKDEIDKVNNLRNNYKRLQKVTRTFKIMEIFQPEGIQDENIDMKLTKNKADVPLSSTESNNDNVSIMSRMVNKSQVTDSTRGKTKKVEDDGAKTFNLKLKKKELQEQLGFDIDDFYKEKKLKFKNFNSDKKRVCIAKDSDDWKFWWDTAILLLAIWNSITIPVAVSFEPQWSQTESYELSDTLINLVFFMDIIVAFNTSYFNADGEEVIDRKLIAIRYIKGLFLIDLISSLPFNLINKSLNVLSILKVVRIRRLSIMINKLSLTEESKAYIKILQLIFYLFLYMHILGCTWYYIVAVLGSDQWIPPLDFIWAGSDKIYQFYTKDTTYRYMVSLYCAVLALGGNEMGPRTDSEIILMLLILLGCAILNANIFGEMTVLVQVGSRKSSQFQEQVDVANTAMKNINLPSYAQQQVRQYLITTQGTRFEQEELKKFIELISPSIKQKVAVSIFSKVIVKNSRIKSFINSEIAQNYGSLTKIEQSNVKENMIFEIVYRMEIESIEPDEIVIQQYSEGSSMYFVAKGECQVNVSEGKKKDENPKFLRPGDYFGEIALIYGCKRTAKVFAVKYSTLAKLSNKNFRELMIIMPQLTQMFQAGIFTYQDRMLKFIKRSLRKVPYFSSIEDQALFDIIYSLKTERFQKGQILQQPGDDATSLFFLQQGIIEVYTRFEGKEFVMERLFRGAVINYRTFFMEEHGQVYIRFSTQSIMQELTYSKMEVIAEKFPQMNSAFQRYKLEIIRKGDAIPLDYIMCLPKRVNRKLSKQVRQQLIEERKSEIDDMLTDRRSQAQSQGFDLSPDDEIELVKAQVNEGEIAERMDEAFRLENLLKNVVIRRLSEIREVKGQKTIKESVELVIQQQSDKEARSRIKLKKKLMRQYEDQVAQKQQDNDLLYNRILINMDRLLKILTAHSQAVDSLERKLEVIQSKKVSFIKALQFTKSMAEQKSMRGDSQEPKHANKYEKLYDSQEFTNFPMVNDDIMSENSQDERRDQILANLTNAQAEPDRQLMAMYHFTVDQTELEAYHYDSKSESLNNISSYDSDNRPESEDLSEDEEEAII